MREFESPSSINTYVLCPRKYYYRYIRAIVPPEDIILLRGKIIHKVVEEIFNIKEISTNFEFELKIVALELLKKTWDENLSAIKSLNLDSEIVKSYYEESREMVMNFANYLSSKLKQSQDFNQLFTSMKGEREVNIFSQVLGVRGVLDVVLNDKIIDYKTSSRDNITNEYKLQLGIYTLLFEEKYKKLPSSASLYFFKFGERELKITEDLIKEAKEKILLIKSKTTTEEKENYPLNVGKHCNWGIGKCPYFGLCFPKTT